ncbi:2-oxoglutarate dehydrogenase complex dihydrolipoyllysine-residue succinyltransferase [Psychromonas sp. PT13]|uniref:2-oxoglutarate dehydrogenase complex dihydrolipoyllysine-residue succinyltransferase n=1 Tax=Psychromonas sp. PT13 TaxID=3439547 RepID=UPI003EC0B86F
MMIEILVPELPESVADATVAQWHKQAGDFVERDEVLVEIETDKVILEVLATASGVLETIIEEQGATVLSKQLLAKLEEGDIPAPEVPKEEPAQVADASPSLRRLMNEHDIDSSQIQGSGKGGRITRADVDKVQNPPAEIDNAEREKRVPMTRIRKRVAERLLEAQSSMAMLTTFNEINMQPIKDLRKKYQKQFEEKHGIRLGFMSFYIKAVTEALQRYPLLNSSIDGDDIVYHNFFDVSIAVATPRGLVTPVIHDTDTLSFAEIEQTIKALAIKGQDGKLTTDDLSGGNFTITNGGVFGSLLSTPIINPPQAAILGMHTIKERPMAVDGEVVILPMMYLALSYDHRLIDGQEAVGFLVTIKELLEDPARLLLNV